jgi:hypothetical protein
MGGTDSFGLSPQQIYEQLTSGPGSLTLDNAQLKTQSEWGMEDDRARQIRKLGENIRRGWQGEASDAAFGAAQPLAEAALRGADNLNSAQDLLSRQSGSFHRAFNDVRPVPAQPPANPLGDMIPFETDIDREVKAYQADAQHNVQVFEGYDNASLYNETNMPKEYSNISQSGGTITVKPAGGDTGGDSGDPGDGRRERGPGGTGPGSGQPGNPGGGTPGGSPVGGPPPGGAPVGGPGAGGPGAGGQQTSPSDVRPGPGVGGFPQSPAASGQPGGGTAPPGGFFPGGGFPGSSGGPGGGTGGFGGRGGGGSTGGFGGRGGGAGAGGGGAGGPGARGPVPGAGPGAGAGALAAEEAAVRRGGLAGSGARGAGGMPMGGMGAGKGQGDEDEEHERKIMIESGGEDVFGSDVLTAPQVIGDDEYED